MDLRSVEYNPEKDPERVAEFSAGMVERWSKGRKEYGSVFKTDPIEEAKSECLDCANYMLVVYFRLKDLEKRLKADTKDSPDKSLDKKGFTGVPIPDGIK